MCFRLSDIPPFLAWFIYKNIVESSTMSPGLYFMNKFVEKIVEMANWFHLFIYRIKPRAGEIKMKESRDRGLKTIADLRLFTFFSKYY